ncbi:MAG TPA: GNAT family protein [Anaerolineales bacterium]|nr:GNAT family protein [Anaerolineales bacterium]
MSIADQLFEGELIRLAPPDPERDADTESAWTHDPDYMRLISVDPIRPLSAAQVKKNYEAIEKDNDKQFYFAIRAMADDRLIGFAKLDGISWTHGSARLTMAIGSTADWDKGYGREALQMILRYAFGELNLYRIGAWTFEYNERGLRFLQMAGFQVEVRQRQSIHRDGRRWDGIWLGLLRSEWESK